MSDDPTTDGTHDSDGLDRRSLIKRSALVGGALVWTTPLVLATAGPAFGDVGTGETGIQALCPVGTIAGTSTSDKFDYPGDFAAQDISGVRADGPNATGPVGGNVDVQCFAESGTVPRTTPRAAPGVVLATAQTGRSTATITLLPGFIVQQAGIKAGQACITARITRVAGTGNTFLVAAPNGSQDISNIIFRIAPCVPAPVTP